MYAYLTMPDIYLISNGYIYKKDNHFSDFLEKTCNHMGMNFIKYEHVSVKEKGILTDKMKNRINRLNFK